MELRKRRCNLMILIIIIQLNYAYKLMSLNSLNEQMNIIKFFKIRCMFYGVMNSQIGNKVAPWILQNYLMFSVSLLSFFLSLSQFINCSHFMGKSETPVLDSWAHFYSTLQFGTQIARGAKSGSACLVQLFLFQVQFASVVRYKFRQKLLKNKRKKFFFSPFF